MDKKALSPIITTVLLVLIAIALAVVIFMWAVAFRGEQITKFIDGESKDIKLSCDGVLFKAELTDNQISIVNTGNVPIYRFDVRLKGAAASKITQINTTQSRVNPGQSAMLDISSLSSSLASGTELDVIPVLLGTDKTGAEKEASCIDSGKWEVIIVQ